MAPSSSQMIALLGLLAVAGYQNRDRLGALFGQITGQNGNDRAALPDQEPEGDGNSILSGLGSLFNSGGVAGGLGELLDRFTGSGQGEVARSWVEKGPNREPSSVQLESALGEDTIEALTRQTGLSRAELLARLKAVLPAAVDGMTPEGRLPTQTEASRWLEARQ